MDLTKYERLERENFKLMLKFSREKYLRSLLANYKIWTIPQIININLVPAQYRVLFANLVALIWNFYLATSKRN